MYGLREGPQHMYVHTSGGKGAWLLASQGGPGLTKVEEPLSRIIFHLWSNSGWGSEVLRFDQSVILSSSSAILHVGSQDQQRQHRELVGNTNSQAPP